MRVSFDGGHLNERGVAVALFDYAFHARALLGVDPVVLHDVRDPPNPATVERFAAEFPTFPYGDEQEMQRLIARERIDLAYFLKTRGKDARVVRASRTAVHEVFRFHRPHGDSYAYISDWLAREMSGGVCASVPHIVDLPSSGRALRGEIGIPSDAFVVGRHGGGGTFDIPFLPGAIEAALQSRANLWLLLLNTNRFSDHPRIVHLPAVAHRSGIADFIDACDAGLNGRRVGETFGLAIAEFLSRDKPVFVWEGGRDRNHLELVADPACRYRTRADLARLLTEWTPKPGDGFWRARVAEFAPANVMAKFGRVFLGSGGAEVPRRPIGFKARLWARDRLRRWREAEWLAS